LPTLARQISNWSFKNKPKRSPIYLLQQKKWKILGPHLRRDGKGQKDKQEKTRGLRGPVTYI